METYYENRQLKEFLQRELPQLPETPISSAYNDGIDPEKKENLFKEIYSNIALFRRLVYEARKEK